MRWIVLLLAFVWSRSTMRMIIHWSICRTNLLSVRTECNLGLSKAEETTEFHIVTNRIVSKIRIKKIARSQYYCDIKNNIKKD